MDQPEATEEPKPLTPAPFHESTQPPRAVLSSWASGPASGTFQWPVDSGRLPQRRALTLGAVFAVLALAGALAAVWLTGGSGNAAVRTEATTHPPSTTTTLPPPPLPPQPLARSASMTNRPRSVLTIVRFLEGRLAASSIVVMDDRIGDGRAFIELRKPGIRSAVGANKLGGLSVRIKRATDRLLVTLRAKPRAFVGLRVRRDSTGRVLALVATKAPEPKPPVTEAEPTDTTPTDTTPTDTTPTETGPTYTTPTDTGPTDTGPGGGGGGGGGGENRSAADDASL